MIQGTTVWRKAFFDGVANSGSRWLYVVRLSMMVTLGIFDCRWKARAASATPSFVPPSDVWITYMGTST